MNSKIKFYQSIQFKIALVFALMLMLTLEVVGAVFVRQLERQNMTTFKQQVELPTYVNNSLASQLTKPNESQANKQIKAILASINNNTITEIRVIDGKGVIRGTSLANTQGSVGQRTTDKMIKATLATNRAHTVVEGVWGLYIKGNNSLGHLSQASLYVFSLPAILPQIFRPVYLTAVPATGLPGTPPAQSSPPPPGDA